MPDFLVADLENLCKKIHYNLDSSFPNRYWVILPQINLKDNLISMYIATHNNEEVIQYTAVSKLINPWDLDSNETIEKILKHFRYFLIERYKE
jgi:hypothetical protein